MKRDRQVKFNVESDLMARCDDVFNAQGVGLSEGMERLIRLLVESPPEMPHSIAASISKNRGTSLKVARSLV